MSDFIIDEDLKMTTIAKITNKRVANIQLGELYNLVPLATHQELRLLKKDIQNEKRLEMEEHHENIGGTIIMILSRIMQKEVTDELKEWEK